VTRSQHAIFEIAIKRSLTIKTCRALKAKQAEVPVKKVIL
jgi:hypothetical protein